MLKRNITSAGFMTMARASRRTLHRRLSGIESRPIRIMPLRNGCLPHFTFWATAYHRTMGKPHYGVARQQTKGMSVHNLASAISMPTVRVFHKTIWKPTSGLT